MKKVILIIASALVMLATVSCNNTPKKNAAKAAESTECPECVKHQAEASCCEKKAGACAEEGKAHCDGKKECCKKAEGQCDKKKAGECCKKAAEGDCCKK